MKTKECDYYRTNLADVSGRSSVCVYRQALKSAYEDAFYTKEIDGDLYLDDKYKKYFLYLQMMNVDCIGPEYCNYYKELVSRYSEPTVTVSKVSIDDAIKEALKYKDQYLKHQIKKLKEKIEELENEI